MKTPVRHLTPSFSRSDAPARRTRMRRTACLSLLAALSACSAIQDQSYSCSGFEEQSSAVLQSGAAPSHRRISQAIPLHIRKDHVMVKSFRAERLAPEPGAQHRIRFGLQAKEAHMRGSFDPNTGVLSYDESHHSMIDQQEHITQITGLYRCAAR